MVNIAIKFPYQSGWWYTNPSEKYEFVSWGYYSQYDGKVIKLYKIHVPNHQPVLMVFLWFSYGFPMVSPPQTFPNFRHSAGALPMDSGISFFTNSRSWTLLASWRSLKTEPLGSGSLTLMRRLLIFVGIILPNI